MSPGPASDGGDSAAPLGSRIPYNTILDIDIQSADRLPFEPPVTQYLDESLMGLVGSPHDVKTRQGDPKLKRCVDHLFRIMHTRTEISDGAKNACSELFFIALGLVFNRVPPDVVEVMRGNLARSWHVICLAALKDIPEDVDMRDWAKTAIPMVMVQAIYRLLIDAFPLDRPHFVSSSAQILDKLSQLAHFETTGFQMQLDVCRKERKRLFLNYVLNSPSTSLEQLEEEQQRKELCAGMRKKQKEPLVFGTLNRPGLECNQLADILEIREEKRIASAPPPKVDNRRKTLGTVAMAKTLEGFGTAAKRPQSQRASLGGASAAAETILVIPDGLGVERYIGLSERGAEIHERQLRDLARSLGEEAGSDNDSDSEVSRPVSRSNSVAGREGAPSSPQEATKQGWMVPADGSAFQVGRSKEKDTKAAKTRAKIRSASMNSKEPEKHSKARKDLVMARINAPLPHELCQRKVSTNWVSPAVTRLYGEDGDRNVLRKSPSESFFCQMENPILADRPASAPRKVPPGSKFLERCGSAPQTCNRGGGGKDATGNTALSSSSGGRQCQASADTTHNSLASSHRRTVLANGRVPSAGQGGSDVAETLTMGVKPISMKTTMQRLENMKSEFHKQAFGNYMKEYDIFTGEKKARFDGQRLRGEEEKCVRDMSNLVNVKLPVNPFSKTQQTRMAKVAASCAPPKAAVAKVEDKQGTEGGQQQGTEEGDAQGQEAMVAIEA